jgi:Flp pilus assembly secretin CpaC
MSGFKIGHVARIAVLAALTSSASGLAHAESIKVVMNQAKIVKLSRAADTIVVGNPLIADAAVKDPQTIVLTGKGFGVTNFVVLDSKGVPIVDEQIEVSRNSAETVRVYRRSKIQTLSCTPSCESAFKSEAEAAAEIEASSANY